ncbi:WYL domain-containing protein [Psychrilyobacter sp.]|uniref:helix-turn-helix transcriptional regulator n=1 Tax=Psychrilyobacter sp. TaxID=2586924 RepID=UPI003018D977
MKFERILGILFYILNRDRVSANTLAKYFGVSRRTIIRDIDTLSLAGIPIYSEIGSKGGYSINREYKLNGKIINKTNSQYILLALKSLKSVYGEKEVYETYEKVKHIFSNHDDKLLELDFSVVNENIDIIESISILKNAIQNKTSVSFDYTNIKNEHNKIKIDPLHVFYKWYGWYVFGYNYHNKNFRMYKIVRMKKLKQNNDHWIQLYNIKELMEDHEKNRNNNNIIVTLRYRREVQTLVEEYLKGLIINETETEITSEVTLKEDNFILFSIILGFGDKIKVISPNSFSEKIKLHLEKTLEKISRNSDI